MEQAGDEAHTPYCGKSSEFDDHIEDAFGDDPPVRFTAAARVNMIFSGRAGIQDDLNDLEWGGR